MKTLGRVKTHLPGLDTLLGGGLLEAGVYFLQGAPGTGKTTLANQLCFAHIAAGGNALYLTLLAESHARMMQHMLGQSFFDASLVGSRIGYVSGYRALVGGDLKAIVGLVRTELTRQRATMLVLDGLVLPPGAEDDAGTKLKEFVHEMQSLATLIGCNVLLLTSGQGRSIAAEQTMVDGIFVLEDHAFGMRNERLIQITKFRGAAPVRGKHSFCITGDGLHIFPRLESVQQMAPRPDDARGVTGTGVAALDAMFGSGGLRRGSTTLVKGPAGVGKTLLALRFLAEGGAEERGVMLGFNEDMDDLGELAAGVGIDLQRVLAAGALKFCGLVAERHALDQLGHLLLQSVDRLGARRVVIDSIGGLAATVMFPERGSRFVGALCAELRQRGVATLIVCDQDELAALGAPSALGGLDAVAEQTLRLSVVGGRRQLRIEKARGQGFDPAPRSFEISALGLRLDPAD
ncbi:MAG TPA: ATPase domain-containing protein [Methylibium sp.]|uniref:ATPase domain-containing protein n=1 Tax=Methylibium sp. TaxID=2067992 RepID=UPI002DBF48FA|nr:ATPase domain-containing protein [Methylibium sp.]HEU4460900.1 ATPase domain-containing protein [Methylibium sp.]